MGMREMQALAYEKRLAHYLLLKAPPASGKSRALMFLALDKLHHQHIKKAIIAVPEMSIAGSFADTDLTTHGFFADWRVLPENNLCIGTQSDKSKVQAFIRFMQSADQVLLCTHSTLRFAMEQLAPTAFDRAVIAIDEFHHVSAHENSVLGKQLDRIMQESSAHLIAMTGSYFRGDAMPILTPEDEAKFEQVTYTYYDQLNGYQYLKSLGLGYHFYQGNYFDALPEVLDRNKKTIIHIPNVNSAESTGRKYDEVGRILDYLGELEHTDEYHIHHIRTPDGKLIKVADLVEDDNATRTTTMGYLRQIKQADDLDMIIALGMAKEGFDWQFCEHVLTIGYRASLTEVVQIIGRATRDCEGKQHAQFTNLIAQPDAEDDDVKNAVNNLLKAISLSLLMEQVLAPNITFRPRSGILDHEKLPAGTIIVDDTTRAPSSKVLKILNGGKDELISALLQDNRTMQAVASPELDPAYISDILLPQVIKTRYPDLDDEEAAMVQSGIMQSLVINQNGGVVNEGDLPPDAKTEGERGASSQFIKLNDRFININNLSIDLIREINPFQRAFEVLAKDFTPEVLKTIQAQATASRTSMTEEEARMLWHKIKAFITLHGKEPNQHSSDPLEKRMAEAIAFLRVKKAEQLS
ncbi:ATP-dependent helicase [Moraxella caviae]|nr:ATP-dependent helicase [Moraxella caviae]